MTKIISDIYKTNIDELLESDNKQDVFVIYHTTSIP